MKVSVVLLSWNRMQEIIKTIEDLKKQSYPEFEVIVVDQGSADNTCEEIDKRFKNTFKRLKIIQLGHNVGVPAGRNIGAGEAAGEVMIFIDNDASLDNRGIEKCLNTFNIEKNTAIISFKIVNADSGKIAYSSWPFQKKRLKDSDNRFYTYTYSGGGSAIKRNVFQQVGGYWEELFFTWEEMELSIKVLDAGYDILYDPSIMLYHRKSEQHRIDNSKYNCMRLRNSLWVTWKYFPFRFAVKETFLRIGAYFIKSIKGRFFLMMLIYFIKAHQKIYFVWNKKHKISNSTLIKYLKLSQRGNLIEQIKFLLK